MRLQVDNEFQEVKIKDLHDQNSVQMFYSRTGKELKTRISKLIAQKLKIPSTKIILSSTENMNNVQSEKYRLNPEEIETKSISNERFKRIFNIHWIERTKLVNDRLNRYNKKKYGRKQKKMRENFNINEKILVLAERIQLQESFTKNLFKIYLTLTKRKYFLLEKSKKTR